MSSLYFRQRDLVTKARAAKGSIIRRIKELANMDRVSALNSKRQAEFLRGVGSNARGRSLAKRAESNDLGDLDEVIPNIIRALIEYIKVKPLTEPTEDPRSYDSNGSLYDCLTYLLDLEESDIANLSAPISRNSLVLLEFHSSLQLEMRPINGLAFSWNSYMGAGIYTTLQTFGL